MIPDRSSGLIRLSTSGCVRPVMPGSVREWGERVSDQHGVTMRLQDALDRIRERDRVMRHRESQQKYFEKNREMVNEKKRIARAGG